MIRRSKITLLAGVAMLAIAGVGTGVALGQGVDTPSRTPFTSYSVSPSPTPSPPDSNAPSPTPSPPSSDSPSPNPSAPVWQLKRPRPPAALIAKAMSARLFSDGKCQELAVEGGSLGESQRGRSLMIPPSRSRA